MTIQNAILIFVLAVVLLALELAVYFTTGMPQALGLTGLSMVAAYKFTWMIVLTGALGLLAPVGAVIGTATNRKTVGLISWFSLVILTMVGYTAISFLNARSAAPLPQDLHSLASAVNQAKASAPAAPKSEAETSAPRAAATAPASPAPPASTPAPPAAPAASRKIADVIEFAGSKVDAAEADKLRVAIQFKNKSTHRITELDYAFTFVDENNKVLLSIDLREGLFIPPGLTGESTLDWAKSGFKDPASFDKLNDAYKKGALKVSVTIQKATLDDGSIAEG